MLQLVVLATLQYTLLKQATSESVFELSQVVGTNLGCTVIMWVLIQHFTSGSMIFRSVADADQLDFVSSRVPMGHELRYRQKPDKYTYSTLSQAL